MSVIPKLAPLELGRLTTPISVEETEKVIKELLYN